MSTQFATNLSDERLALLCHLTQSFNRSLDLDEVLSMVIDEIIAATKAERGFVVLREDDGKLVFPVARGINQTNIEDPEFQISHGVIDQVLTEGKPVLTHDAQVDNRFSGMQSVAFLGITSVMCAPLKVKNNILGATYVENRVQAGIFTEEHLELLSAIASSAAIAIENARLYQIAVEKGRMERDLQVARRVQSSFIPKEICEPDGWQVSAYLEPAREVGGDFYDVFSLADEHRFGLVIADVCDKGVGAALFMALFRSLIRAFSEQHYSGDWLSGAAELMSSEPNSEQIDVDQVDKHPGAAALKSIIELTNNYIAINHGETSMFATLFFGILDPSSGIMQYVNAGHEPPVLIGKNGTKARLQPTGPALGLFPDLKFGIQEANFEPGDTLLAYTDGAFDARGPDGDNYTEERLIALAENSIHTPGKLLPKIVQNLEQYMAECDQYDDITLLAVQRLP